MKKYRIGLIGCGWIARLYARILPRLADRAEVVWAADPETLRSGEIAHQTGARSLADYRQGLGEVDAVCVLVPHHLHHPIAGHRPDPRDRRRLRPADRRTDPGRLSRREGTRCKSVSGRRFIDYKGLC